MIVRNTRLILGAEALSVLSTVFSSLIGARALGPAGRGDLLIVVLWPPVIAMVAGLGLPTAYRYWIAKDHSRVSNLFSNAIIYTAIVGVISIFIADMTIPHLVGQRSHEVMTLLRVYQINILPALMMDLMLGMLEGTKRFGWSGAARTIFFVVQAAGFAALWFAGHLTVATGMIVMMSSQASAMTLALTAVLRKLRPRWQPSWSEFKNSLQYGVRDYPGGVADFTTLRLDQMMLGAVASNVAIGLYVIAVRCSEVTSLAATAVAAALMPEVAASTEREQAEALWSRSLRITLYLDVVLLVPLWLGAPYILRVLFGASFVPATQPFRWLLLAAAAWGLGSIVISGLRGFGHPGLSTMAKFTAAIVTAVALVTLLPKYGITGAALASLIGYTTMLGVGLISFIWKRQIRLRDCLLPQRQDILMANWTSVRAFVFSKAADS